MYANNIFDGNFNKVTENPNEDTVFELILESPTAITAKITVAESAYPRVLANPSVLEGTDKQVIGKYTKVIIKEPGEARK
jgi:hypothetical protein